MCVSVCVRTVCMCSVCANRLYVRYKNSNCLIADIALCATYHYLFVLIVFFCVSSLLPLLAARGIVHTKGNVKKSS